MTQWWFWDDKSVYPLSKYVDVGQGTIGTYSWKEYVEFAGLIPDWWFAL